MTKCIAPEHSAFSKKHLCKEENTDHERNKDAESSLDTGVRGHPVQKTQKQERVETLICQYSARTAERQHQRESTATTSETQRHVHSRAPKRWRKNSVNELSIVVEFLEEYLRGVSYYVKISNLLLKNYSNFDMNVLDCFNNIYSNKSTFE